MEVLKPWTEADIWQWQMDFRWDSKKRQTVVTAADFHAGSLSAEASSPA